jgi:hypothetical protein
MLGTSAWARVLRWSMFAGNHGSAVALTTQADAKSNLDQFLG